MNIEAAREYCLTKKAATEGLPFGDDFLVLKVMGKMFAAIDLRERYNAVEGAWHFNKKYWNQVFFDRDADDALICHLIDHSYDEVLKKFTRKMRNEYDNLL